MKENIRLGGCLWFLCEFLSRSAMYSKQRNCIVALMAPNRVTLSVAGDSSSKSTPQAPGRRLQSLCGAGPGSWTQGKRQFSSCRDWPTLFVSKMLNDARRTVQLMHMLVVHCESMAFVKVNWWAGLWTLRWKGQACVWHVHLHRQSARLHWLITKWRSHGRHPSLADCQWTLGAYSYYVWLKRQK